MKCIIVTILVCATLAMGQGKGKGKGKGGESNSPAQDGVHSILQVQFGNDRPLIEKYCRSLSTANLPPGLAKPGGDLPPGLEKQLQRNGHLPPGLEKRISYFPPDLERQLRPLPPDYTRAFVGGRAVIMNKATQVIVDIFIPF
jgi:hypothetical protein